MDAEPISLFKTPITITKQTWTSSYSIGCQIRSFDVLYKRLTKYKPPYPNSIAISQRSYEHNIEKLPINIDIVLLDIFCSAIGLQCYLENVDVPWKKSFIMSKGLSFKADNFKNLWIIQ
jgi:hypothetical protein